MRANCPSNIWTLSQGCCLASMTSSAPSEDFWPPGIRTPNLLLCSHGRLHRRKTEPLPSAAGTDPIAAYQQAVVGVDPKSYVSFTQSFSKTRDQIRLAVCRPVCPRHME